MTERRSTASVLQGTSIQPQLSVRHGRAALEFYKAAFGAVELYRVGGTDAHEAVVAQLSVGEAAFWVADESPEHENFSPESVGGGTVRMLLIVDDPNAAVRQAISAGATEVRPVAEEHGWLLGRIRDPFGHHWEIGKPLAAWPPGAVAARLEPSPVFRPSGVSYLRIPAEDVRVSAAFYRSTFGWTVSDDLDHPRFADGSGHVIGHFMTDLPVATDGGIRPYIYVNSIDVALAAVDAHGGRLLTGPCPEGDLWVSTFRDPAGNVVGLWQRGPR